MLAKLEAQYIEWIELARTWRKRSQDTDKHHERVAYDRCAAHCEGVAEGLWIALELLKGTA